MDEVKAKGHSEIGIIYLNRQNKGGNPAKYGQAWAYIDLTCLRRTFISAVASTSKKVWSWMHKVMPTVRFTLRRRTYLTAWRTLLRQIRLLCFNDRPCDLERYLGTYGCLCDGVWLLDALGREWDYGGIPLEDNS